VTVLELSGDGHFEVLATNGDTHLGGDDFDQVIVEWLLAEFKKDQGVDLSKDKIALQRIREAAEKAKIELSSQNETEINLPFITADNTGPKHLNIKLSRAKMEALVSDLIERTVKPCEAALKGAGRRNESGILKMSDINQVVLVGGMTRMPAVQKKVKELFGKEPHKGVNPDEVVAIGAAIQAGQISGDIGRDIIINDVLPISVGIETLGGVATKLIDSNSRIPTTTSQVFSTAADNQTSVEINIVQGEREMAADNKSLGRFILDGILAAPRGMPQVQVSFDVDTNGILSVKAKDLGTGKEQHITIQGSTGLSKDEVERMKKDAEVNAEEDKKKKELVDARNGADGLIFSLEKQMREYDAKIADDVKKKVNEKMNALREVLKKKDASVEEIKKATEALATDAQEIGKTVYEEAKKKADEEAKKGQEGSKGNKEKVVDAEVVDDDKKDKKEKK
jgi:molecular chaperone DnaK